MGLKPRGICGATFRSHFRLPALNTLAINALILAIGLIVVELIFGNWLHQNQLYKLNIPKGVTLSFDASGLYESAGEPVLYSRDENGLRGWYSSASEIDILTIGGSTTDQRFIAEGSTWQDVMASALSTAEKRISVVNAGLDGQSTYGHIKNFEWWFPNIPDLRPTYILCYIGVNDLFQDEANLYDKIGELRAMDQVKEFIKTRSALYYLYRTLRGHLKAVFVHGVEHGRIDFSDRAWTDQPVADNYEALAAEHLQKYTHRLEVLLSRIIELGAEPILVTQPSRQYRKTGGKVLGVKKVRSYNNARINGVDFYHLLDLMNETTLQTARVHGVKSIDLESELTFTNDDFYDYYHNTPSGARKIGLFLADKMRPMLSQK